MHPRWLGMVLVRLLVAFAVFVRMGVHLLPCRCVVGDIGRTPGRGTAPGVGYHAQGALKAGEEGLGGEGSRGQEDEECQAEEAHD